MHPCHVVWKSCKEEKKDQLLKYSLIYMRLIYYYDAWVIIWHAIVPVFINICTESSVNLCKSSYILKQHDVKWWLNYRKYGSVSYSFTCIWICIQDYFPWIGKCFRGWRLISLILGGLHWKNVEMLWKKCLKIVAFVSGSVTFTGHSN